MQDTIARMGAAAVLALALALAACGGADDAASQGAAESGIADTAEVPQYVADAVAMLAATRPR